MPVEKTRPVPRLDALTSLRFVAAALVLLRHAVMGLAPLPFLEPVAEMGAVGVTFFFALSGFVLVWSAQPGESAGTFWRKRLARVYPLHVILTALAAVVIVLHGGRVQDDVALVCVFLLQAWFQSKRFAYGFNTLSWSLSCEAFFYFMFPFLLPRVERLDCVRCLRWIFGIIGLLTLTTIIYGAADALHLPGVGLVDLYTFPVYRLGQFAAGMLLAYAIRLGWRPIMSAARGVAITVATYGLVVTVHVVMQRAGITVGQEAGLPVTIADLLVLPAVLVLLACVVAEELDGGATSLQGRWFQRLGQWSFALYLIQALLLDGFLTLIGGRPDGALLQVGAVVVFSAVAIGLSGLTYHLLERPIERSLRAAWLPARPVPDPAPSSAP
jgi:peptidoglycan/LPS O-acetylase OafA/YrhL